MTNNISTTNSIFSASERELFRPLAEASESRILTLSMAEIIAGLFADYKSFSSGIAAGIRIPDKKVEPRMVHSSILFAEGLRLAYYNLELAKKLMLASLFYGNVRSLEWLKENGEAKQIEAYMQQIKDFEDWKAEERRKKAEEEMRLKGLIKQINTFKEKKMKEELEDNSRYDLDRFLRAQENAYPEAFREMEEGHKYSHWIWYIFPQQKGLGHSYNSEYYGLDGIDEARAYLAHPILGARLREISEVLLQHEGKDILRIMGSSIDALKLETCMRLFNRVSPNDVFDKVLRTFFI